MLSDRAGVGRTVVASAADASCRIRRLVASAARQVGVCLQRRGIEVGFRVGTDVAARKAAASLGKEGRCFLSDQCNKS